MLDTNAFVGHWPFDQMIATMPDELETHLKSAGVTQACAYSMEGVFYPDPQVANERFLDAVEGSDFYLGSGVVDPTLVNWRSVVDELRRRWSVPMIRLFPNYHSYELGDPFVSRLLDYAAEKDIAVAIHVRLLDERRHHPLMPVPQVPLGAVAEALQKHRATRFLLCGAVIREAARLAAEGPDNLYVEISSIEYVSTIERLMRDVRVDRIVLGTHAPLHYPHAGVAKIKDAPIPEDQLVAISVGNARELLRCA